LHIKHVESEGRILGLSFGNRVIEGLRGLCEEIEAALYDVVK
jgi:hypothetical protein